MTFVVFAGQSNALGYGMDRSTLENAEVGSLTFIWNPARGCWEPMAPGVNTGTAANPEAWGPEVGFAQAFHRDNPFEPLFILKSAKGSTSLAAAPDGLDWSPESHGELFDQTTDQITLAREALHGADVDATFLFQGEQDAADATMAADYAENLRGWLAAIRDQWMRNPDGAVAYGRVNDDLPFVDAVRLAQVEVDREDQRAVSFETDGFVMQADMLHYAATGFLEIGRSFFSALESWG